MKDHVVTYINPATRKDLPLGKCVLHGANCRYLLPAPNRPFSGSRNATLAELPSQPACKVC